MKMALVPMPKLIPVGKKGFKVGEQSASLSSVLQSEPVKRLLSQPNIIIKAVPLNSTTNSLPTNVVLINKKNGVSNNLYIAEKPRISIKSFQTASTPITVSTPATPENEDKEEQEEEEEEERLLPSKTKGKSQVTIQSISRKKKPCGHYGPCEDVVCNVVLQNYADENGVSPMLATSIDEDDINAPVSKHCTNERCDALSIDHDRCRRLIIKLHKCDKQNFCDICGITLSTRKSRSNHKNCKRKSEYQHNDIACSEILRRKMREREIQMLAADKARTYDYLDPVNGHNRALELLKKNEQLIVIPKTTAQSQQQAPMVTITSIPTISTIPTVTKISTLTTKQQNVPIVIPSQVLILNPTQTNTVVTNQVTKQGQIIQNPFFTVSAVQQPQGTQNNNNIRPLILGNWVNNQTQVNCDPATITKILQQLPNVITTPIQPKSFLTPIRVVPIANFKTEPSLLHQVQGMPRFCIMADTGSIQTPRILNPPPLVRLQPIQPNNNPQPNIIISDVRSEAKPQAAVQSSSDSLGKKKKKKIRKMYNRKSLIRNRRKVLRDRMGKTFTCPFCSKRLGTDWYFKMHVARHKGETPYVCRVCEKSFVNKYEMKKHFSNKHVEEEIACELCTHVVRGEVALKEHMSKTQQGLKCSECEETCENCKALDAHQKKVHGFAPCRICYEPVGFIRFQRHMIMRHGSTKNRADDEHTKVGGKKEIKIEQLACKQESNGINEEEMEEEEEEEEQIAEEIGDDDFTLEIDEEEENIEIKVEREELEDDAEQGSLNLCNLCGNIYSNKEMYNDHLENCLGVEGDLYINEGILDEEF